MRSLSAKPTSRFITYANQVFVRVAGYSEQELPGQAHNLIRHSDMPRCVIKLLWVTISQGNEIFAYVINLSRNGDHYWVLAHVTPSFDAAGKITNYHSSRLVACQNAPQWTKRSRSATCCCRRRIRIWIGAQECRQATNCCWRTLVGPACSTTNSYSHSRRITTVSIACISTRKLHM
jgi:PAS domain S-box-containing protein